MSELVVPSESSANVPGAALSPLRRTPAWPAVQALWWREIVRFVRQRSRLIGGFAQPLVFWLLLGGGLHSSFQPPGLPAGMSYLTYFYPGIIVLVLLFTAIFATIAVVEDRQGGFLQGVLVAPVARGTIVLGQALGCTTLAVGQGALFLLLAPLSGIHLRAGAVVGVLAVECLLAFALTNLGLIIAWRMDSTQGFHAIMNLILIPIWLLSGAVFPASGASTVLTWVMWLNPLTYGMAALRRMLYLGDPAAIGAVPPLLPSLAVLLAFCAATFWAAARTAQRVRG
jgi:ABC-2 type transport system permease protein